jgi:hypothetical protein
LRAPARPLARLAGAQVLLSLLPDFSSLGFVSALGALMSICYCMIATGLAAAYKPAGPVDYAPVHDTPVTQRVFDVFAAITTMLFAYGGHNIALEIQATLPQPPTVRRMMRGVHIAFVITGGRARPPRAAAPVPLCGSVAAPRCYALPRDREAVEWPAGAGSAGRHASRF